MSKIGLKYISPEGLGFPAVNGGKWNLASNFRGDFARILTESGIGENDYDTPSFFMKFGKEGMFLCVAKRKKNKSSRESYEALWLFVPDGTVISTEQLVQVVGELSGMFDHPQSFISPEAFQDTLSDLFQKEFDEEKNEGKRSPMAGSRIGYINFEDEAELGLILSTGYKSQYENFGLILLTDNPVPVEAMLPRIYLPELMLHRQLRREADTIGEGDAKEENEKQEGDTIAEAIAAVEESGESGDDEQSGEESESHDSEECGNKESGQNEDCLNKDHQEDNPNEGSIIKEEDIEIKEKDENGKETAEETNGNLRQPSSFSMISFWGGFLTASIIFLLIYIVVQIFRV